MKAIDTHYTAACVCFANYPRKHTVSSCLELRSELIRESSDAARWRSASSSREVREMSDAAASCSSFACSTRLETSPPPNDSRGESPIGWRWPSDQPIRDFRFDRRIFLNFFFALLFIFSLVLTLNTEMGAAVFLSINFGFYFYFIIMEIGKLVEMGVLRWGHHFSCTRFVYSYLFKSCIH